MAQRDTKPTHKEIASTKQRSTPTKFQASLSQPTPSNLTTQQTSNPRRHLTLPVPLHNNYSQSPAEQYIISRSEMLFNPNLQQDISPETPSSIVSSNTGTSISSVQSSIGHAERMNIWRQKEANKICKKQKHRYMYGPPPSSMGSVFSSPMHSTSSIQSNLSLPSQIQSSIPSTRTIKKL